MILKRSLYVCLALALGSSGLNANQCKSRLFSVTVDSKLTIGDMVDNLADTCGLTVIVKDEAARMRMKKNLYYVKLKNSTVKGFLDTVLRDNDLYYTLEGNKLTINYLVTKTFRVHYIAGQRIGKSNANVTIAGSNSQSSTSSSGASGTSGATGSQTSSAKGPSGSGMSIESNDEFIFWDSIGKEVQRILIGAGDGSTHYAKTSDTAWVGPDGQVWEYNPVAPIVNPQAGMITVTGTAQQMARVSSYMETLTNQIQKQVMIDVRILSVNFDDSRTTGIDWSQIYSLQNLAVSSTLEAARNIYPTKLTNNIITEWARDESGNPAGASVFATGNVKIQDVIKFLGTQGDVRSLSSPKVMTLNNQPALISVGKEIFYKIQSASTASSGGGAVAAQGETINSVFAGILLDITPEINENGIVTLKINPSISDTTVDVSASSGTRTMPPDLVRRQISSVIKVKDGEHAILGGLISTKEGQETKKVPILGDIPLLGYAFNRTSNIKTTEELVIIITPHVVNDSKDALMKDLGYDRLNEK